MCDPIIYFYMYKIKLQKFSCSNYFKFPITQRKKNLIPIDEMIEETEDRQG